MQVQGFKALLEMIVTLMMIWITFSAIQGIHIERMFRRPPRTLPLLIVLLATSVGFTCAQFLFSFLSAVNSLANLFH